MRSQSAAFAFEGMPTRETSRAFLEQALRGRSSDTGNLIVTGRTDAVAPAGAATLGPPGRGPASP